MGAVGRLMVARPLSAPLPLPPACASDHLGLVWMLSDSYQSTCVEVDWSGT